ncbi:MAG: hypothetical protein JWO74_4378 [Solirubrobacterales bacterium]|jgi:hypothetical protein|nr:hypothetical protein [Solirubrobacterales bacterium]
MEAGPADGPPWPGEARVTFEWLKGRAFLIERWTVPQAFDGIAIIGAGDEPETFHRHYFDGRGEQRVYEMTLRDDAWEQRRADDRRTIACRWEKAPDGSTWEADDGVTYRKVA